MKTIDRIQFKELFEAAIVLPASERAAFLAYRCVENDKLRGDLERLLAADEAAGGFLESSPFDGGGTDQTTTFRKRDLIGTTIDTFYIESEIGAGGMGTVFLAERVLGDIRQRVAIKIVHDGIHTKEIYRRFLQERKILAGLEHSGIARLIDAGETLDGQPYLAMEYVAGKPLDEYSSSQDLSIEKRLELFQKVCEAIAYAHRRLIIHRDLKPANILVTPDGSPKLLDFGIAKLLAPDADVAKTATMMNLLTPAYAAPEQIRGETITTATDVYSLGVILFELLAGVRPFSFGDKHYPEIVRMICETDPPKPSEAYTRENEDHETGGVRGPSPCGELSNPLRSGFERALRGDLDNIVLKALRKDPERRYQSVEQFSEDIQRYQKGLPVSARADTLSYRASKFVERNRVAVVSAGVIVLLLVAGILGTSWQAVRAERQKKVAERRFAQVRELAKNVIFKYHDSIANLTGSTEVRKMLVEDATKYLDSLSQDAGSDESLQNEMALAYSKLADVQGKPYTANTGDTAGAAANYEKSVAIFEGLLKSDDTVISSRASEELITAYHSLSAVRSRSLDFDDSIEVQKKAFELAKINLSADSQELKRRLLFARSNLWLGDAYAEAGNFTEAIDYYRSLIQLAEQNYATAPGDRDAKTILGVAHDRIGRNFLLRGQELARTDFSSEAISAIYRESYEHLAKTLDLFKQVADENPSDRKCERNYSVAQSNLGMALRNVGNVDRSLAILQKVAADSGATLKSDPANRDAEVNHAEDLHQLALTLNADSRPGQADAELRFAIQNVERLIAGDANNLELRRIWLEMKNDYGNILLDRGDIVEALKIFQAALRQVSESDKLANSFSYYAAGLLGQNIGDCYERISGRPSISIAQRRENISRAQSYYHQAFESWRMPDVQRSFLSRTPEMVEYLDRKVSLTDQASYSSAQSGTNRRASN